MPEFIAATTAGNINGTTLSITKPAGVGAGNLMVLFVQVFATGITVASTGWTPIIETDGGSGFGNDFTMAVLTKLDDGTAGPYTVTWDGTDRWRIGAIAGYRGCLGTVDASSGASSGASSATMRSPSLTTIQANTMLVSGGAAEDGSPAVTPPGGMTERAELNGLYIADVVQANPGASGDKDATITASWNVGTMVALAPSPVTMSDSFTPIPFMRGR